MPPAASTVPVRQPGRFARSWGLTKSALNALNLDRELAVLPVIAFGVTLVVLAAYGAVAFNFSLITFVQTGQGYEAAGPLTTFNPVSVLFGFSLLVVTNYVTNFFAAALTHGIVVRFKGGNPTVRASLAGAWARAGALFSFTLLSSTIGYILRAAEERLPWAGVIATRLLGAAWAIASMFAVPVIVTAEQPMGPLAATRQSVDIIKRTWGENLIVTAGVGVVAGFAILGYALSVTTIGVLILGTSESVWLGLGFVAVAVLGIFLLALLFNILGAIIRAAIFYYATTGLAPEQFDPEAVKASLAPKHAR